MLNFFFLRKLEEEEQLTNIRETEIFTLPSGQELEKENILLHLVSVIKIAFFPN